jgi:sodium transport system permease protein
MRTILTIYRKELLDTIRDRRTLLVMIVMPLLLMPALMIGMNKLTASSLRAQSRVVVQGGGNAPQLIALLRSDKTLTLVSGTDATALVKDQKADVGLVIGPDFTRRLAAAQPAPLTVVSDESQASSALGAQRVQALIGTYEKTIADQRLHQRGIDPQVLDVVAIRTHNVASQQAMTGVVLSLILPMFLVIYAMMGGMYTAIDVAAGEKERNTLEALLLTPASKLEVTAGKLLAVTTTAFGTVVIAVGALAFSLQQWPLSTASEVSTVSTANLLGGTLVIMLLLSALLAVAFSALELALSIFARSFKEAQNYITPLYLVALVPVVALTALPTLRPPLGLFLVPAVNAVLVVKEALVGRVDALHVVLSAASLLVFAAAAVAVSTYVFTREQVLFKA